MNISLVLLFLVLITVTQFCTSNILSKRGIQELLLSDGTENGIQNGSDVIMVNPGPLDIVLTEEDKLDFEVCSSKCSADFLVCYEADSSEQNVLELCDSKCGFYITTRGDKIAFMKKTSDTFSGVEKSHHCYHVEMKNGVTSVLDIEGEVTTTTTCKPKVENGIVKLTIMNATDECRVSVKNAIIKPETTTAASTTPEQFAVTSSGNSSEAATDGSDSFIANYWWIFLVLGILIVVVIVGIVIFCYVRRRQSKKPKKPVAPPRKLRESKSPIVLQPSTETQHRTNESAVKPNSLYQQSSILSHKSLMWSKKEGNKSAESTDLTSMKPTA